MVVVCRWLVRAVARSTTGAPSPAHPACSSSPGQQDLPQHPAHPPLRLTSLALDQPGLCASACPPTRYIRAGPASYPPLYCILTKVHHHPLHHRPRGCPSADDATTSPARHLRRTNWTHEHTVRPKVPQTEHMPARRCLNTSPRGATTHSPRHAATFPAHPPMFASRLASISGARIRFRSSPPSPLLPPHP